MYVCGLAGHRRREIARGETKRPRNKFTVIADMLAATANGLSPQRDYYRASYATDDMWKPLPARRFRPIA